MARRSNTRGDGRHDLYPVLRAHCSRLGLLGALWIVPEALNDGHVEAVL